MEVGCTPRSARVRALAATTLSRFSSIAWSSVIVVPETRPGTAERISRCPEGPGHDPRPAKKGNANDQGTAAYGPPLNICCISARKDFDLGPAQLDRLPGAACAQNTLFALPPWPHHPQKPAETWSQPPPTVGTAPYGSYAAKRLKNWSSVPKMTEGRRITAIRHVFQSLPASP